MTLPPISIGQWLNYFYVLLEWLDLTLEWDQWKRTKHLKWLLNYMIPVLIRQNIMFSFYIINQESCSKYLRLKVTIVNNVDYNVNGWISRWIAPRWTDHNDLTQQIMFVASCCVWAQTNAAVKVQQSLELYKWATPLKSHQRCLLNQNWITRFERLGIVLTQSHLIVPNYSMLDFMRLNAMGLIVLCFMMSTWYWRMTGEIWKSSV